MECCSDVLERSVTAMCLVVERDVTPIWVVDSTSGVKPEDLANLKHGVIVKHPHTSVAKFDGHIDSDTMRTAVKAIAQYVGYVTSDRREDG